MNDASWESHRKGIGSKLLQKMGYTGSGGLGATRNGISEPLIPVVRQNRVGLGHDSKKQPSKNIETKFLSPRGAHSTKQAGTSVTSTSLPPSTKPTASTAVPSDIYPAHHLSDSSVQANLVKLIREKETITKLGELKPLYRARYGRTLCHSGKLTAAIAQLSSVRVSSSKQMIVTYVEKENDGLRNRSLQTCASCDSQWEGSTSNQTSKKKSVQASKKKQKKKTKVVKHVKKKQKKKTTVVKHVKKKQKKKTKVVNHVKKNTNFESENVRLQARIVELEAELVKATPNNLP